MDRGEKKERIKTLLERMDADTDVAVRDLQSVLTESQFEQYEQKWVDQKHIRAYTKEKPPAIVEYEKRLRKAIFEYNRAEGYNGSTKRKVVTDNTGLRTNTRAYNRSETLCERLIEYLEGQLTADPTLSNWFDREIIFGIHGNLGTTPVTMPRAITSRSTDRMGSGLLVSKMSKRQIKQDALKDALADIENAEIMEKRVAARIKEEDDAALQAHIKQMNKLRSR